jgi:hypothetical protein
VDSPNNLVASINNIGMKDITSAVNAQVVITCSDMDEMSSGTAAIHGLARALNKKLLLVDTGTIDLVGDGDHRMSRNLMIDHSANAVAKKYQDIPELVDMLFKNDHYA